MNGYQEKYVEGYAKLLTYNQGMEIYQKTKQFTENYLDRIRDGRLTAHMNDSARSVPSNIREGAKRRNTKAYLDFLGFARGSLEELKGDYEELKRELREGLRWSEKDKEGLRGTNKDKEGKIRIEKEIDGLLDLVYGEDCMLGRQIKSVERKALDEKDLPKKDLIRKTWKLTEEREKRFWGLARKKCGVYRDDFGVIRREKDK